ncbi:MAG: HlyD family secretion protein [Planctomycetia bacterium]
MSLLAKTLFLGMIVAGSAGTVALWAKNTSTATPPSAAATAAPSTVDGASHVDAGTIVGFGYWDVEGRPVALSASALGRVEKVYVHENQRVAAGAPLFELDKAKAQAQLALAKSALAQAEVGRGQSRRLAERHELLTAQQREAVAAAKAALDAHRRQVEHLRGLTERGLVDREKFLVANDGTPALEAQERAAELKLTELGLDDPRDGVKLADAAAASAEANVRLAESALKDHTVLAPEAGVVLRLGVAVGQVLGPNQTEPNVWFCPDKPRILRAEVNQNFAALVAAGDAAAVFDDATGRPLGDATVQRCAEWIAPRRSLRDEPLQVNDVRTRECILEPAAGFPELTLGQRVRVMISPAATR